MENPLKANIYPIKHSPQKQPKLLDRLRDKCRVLRRSDVTASAYCNYCREFILFHGKRHPLKTLPLMLSSFCTRKCLASTLARSMLFGPNVPSDCLWL
jgi:hypothetical protein